VCGLSRAGDGASDKCSPIHNVPLHLIWSSD
jgi:hypothetical protein